MKKQIILGALLMVGLLQSVHAAVSKEEWSAFLINNGNRPELILTQAEFDGVVSKLCDLSQNVSDTDRSTLGANLLPSLWSRYMSDRGLSPQYQLSRSEWERILPQLGVAVSSQLPSGAFPIAVSTFSAVP